MKPGKAILVAIAAIVTVFLIAAGVWALGVAVSGPKGQGDAIKTKNSAQNWTAAQARFEDQYQAIISADRKVTLAAEAKAANPTDLTLQQTYSGVVSGCISAVAVYNAESRKFLAEDFKAADLPYQIDDANRSTDCKENTK